MRAACLFLAGWLVAARVFAEVDAAALQRHGIGRIESYRERFQKTGDRTSLLPELELAAQELDSSRAEFVRSGNAAGAARSAIELGNARRMLSVWVPAREAYADGLAWATKAGDGMLQARAHIGLGRVALTGNDFAEARQQFEAAARVGAELKDRKPLFDAVGYVGQVELAMGDLIAAAATFNRALALVPTLKDPSEALYVHLDRAEVFQKLAAKADAAKSSDASLESLKLARADFEAALKIAQQAGQAGLARQIEQFIRGIELRKQMVEMNRGFVEMLAKQNVFRPKKPSDVLVSEKFLAPSNPTGAALIGMLQSSGILSGGDARSLFIAGRAHEMSGDNDRALAAFLGSVALLEADRRNLRDEKGRGEFFEDKIEYYYAPILQFLERRRYAEAFGLLEGSRSRAMADLLFSRKLAFAQPEEQALFGEAQRLRTDIALEQKKLFELRAQPAGAPAAIAATEARIAQLERENRAVAGRMEKQAPKLRELLVSQPVTLARLQETLRKDGIDVLYYLVLEESVILWHIGGESVHVVSVFLPRKELLRKIAALRGSLSDPHVAFDETAARELYLYLVQPALAWLTGRRVAIIPHDELHAVPFQAFIDPEGRAFGERFAISTATNASLLMELKVGGNLAGARLFAAADPDIEAGREEVAAIAALYPGRSRSIVDKLLTEPELRAAGREAELLHLSVHGKFDVRAPLLSYLQLARDGGDDGRLTAAEMFGLPLARTRLVVLSACETGRAEATRANELLGMERALIFAGANNLVLSAWRVDAASTALWMKVFYREAREKSLAEAARLSLVAVKEKYPHPYYWCAFQLVGK